MSNILLSDYLDQKMVYTFDLSKGVVNEDICTSDDIITRKSFGFGGFREVGLFYNKTNVFAAIYAFQDKMYVRVGEKIFNYSDENYVTSRKSIFPYYIKQFTISKDSSNLVNIKYIFTDDKVWPDNGDILSYIERNTRTSENIYEFVKFWTARSRGINILSDEEIAEINRPLGNPLKALIEIITKSF